jgi:DNA-directed RNA polymerase subunit RPC12/RpoP
MPRKDGYYAMIYICSNCGFEFKVDVEFSLPARGQGGKCPYCMVSDGHNGVSNFGFRRCRSEKKDAGAASGVELGVMVENAEI